jgi:3-hydroxymyristoyl/3-hydroxydecanoyl-(acyl carrier protein) dehydratase
MSTIGFECTVCIGAEHPALPGHFPEQPLVPGVILLEQVAEALRAWRNLRLARVLEVKFVAPLLPEQTAQLQLREAAPDGTRLRFEIRRDDVLLARGVIEGAA